MLKASMGDLQKTVFKDELTSYICRNLNVDVPDYAPCILFINGEYWGIHNLREFTSKQYISKKYNVNKDSINILTLDTGRKYNLNKSITNNPMLRLVYNHARTVNFKDSSSYRIINRFFNIESIIDFYCTNLFFANTDYLKNNNKLWQVTKNGKWHQFLYDLDYCWTNAKIDNISPIINQDNYVKNTSHPSLLLTIILINPITKTKFLKRMNYLMENDFSTKKLLKAISLFKKNYKPQMRMHTNRWSRPGSVSQWEKKVSYLEGFARTRHSYFRKHLLKLQ